MSYGKQIKILKQPRTTECNHNTIIIQEWDNHSVDARDDGLDLCDDCTIVTREKIRFQDSLDSNSSNFSQESWL